MSNLPSRLTEKTFRQYESYLIQAAKSVVPIPVFIPKLTNNTVVARLRDALLSYRLNHWPLSESFADSARLEKLKAYHTDTGVYLGFEPPKRVQSYSSPIEKVMLTAMFSGSVWPREDLIMLCTLIQNKRVEGGLTLSRIDDATTFELESLFDISITHDESTNTSLIL